MSVQIKLGLYPRPIVEPVDPMVLDALAELEPLVQQTQEDQAFKGRRGPGRQLPRVTKTLKRRLELQASRDRRADRIKQGRRATLVAAARQVRPWL